ncbi:MAG TPA: hypothetical protein VEQ59_08580 [Polyangiaceae bacterium]|nr:hypothetical protein [Polyangiaceae bacterium]
MLEEPLEDEPPEVELVLAAGVAAGAVLTGLLSVVALAELLSLELSLFFAPPPLLLYRSAYQPPPFRMKPAPPETCRLAVAWWQCGHSVKGAALIDCSASQPWPQAVHAYS